MEDSDQVSVTLHPALEPNVDAAVTSKDTDTYLPAMNVARTVGCPVALIQRLTAGLRVDHGNATTTERGSRIIASTC